jgi:hypothetical protein
MLLAKDALSVLSQSYFKVGKQLLPFIFSDLSYICMLKESLMLYKHVYVLCGGIYFAVLEFIIDRSMLLFLIL